MLVIPAMDIRCGKFVHMLSMPAWEELVGKDDPVEVAIWWKIQNAKMLHITDLDGAFTGVPENLEVIKDIKESIDIPLQVAGGIRSLKHIETVLNAGASRVVLGIIAACNPELVEKACKEFGEKVVIGIEGKNNIVASEGWNQPIDWTVSDMAKHLRELGVTRVVYNDVSRDGSLKGPNLDVAQELTKTGLKVVLSGGVSSLQDLKEIAKFKDTGIEGVIVGKALYTKNLIYSDTLNLATV